MELKTQYWDLWVHGFPRSLCVQRKYTKDFFFLLLEGFGGMDKT